MFRSMTPGSRAQTSSCQKTLSDSTEHSDTINTSVLLGLFLTFQRVYFIVI